MKRNVCRGGCDAGSTSDDLGFSFKWKVPCSREVSLFREAVVFVHETVFRVIVCFPAL